MNPKKILIVEDNKDCRTILRYQLKKIGDFDIREAFQGEEALALITQATPDLIFLDLKLPVLDGWETARRIRSLSGAAKNIPIIALTAQAMEGDREKALAAGCNEYIAKPMRDGTLLKEKMYKFLP